MRSASKEAEFDRKNNNNNSSKNNRALQRSVRAPRYSGPTTWTRLLWYGCLRMHSSTERSTEPAHVAHFFFNTREGTVSVSGFMCLGLFESRVHHGKQHKAISHEGKTSASGGITLLIRSLIYQCHLIGKDVLTL